MDNQKMQDYIGLLRRQETQVLVTIDINQYPETNLGDWGQLTHQLDAIRGWRMSARDEADRSGGVLVSLTSWLLLEERVSVEYETNS